MSFPAVSESPAQERKSWAGLRKNLLSLIF